MRQKISYDDKTKEYGNIGLSVDYFLKQNVKKKDQVLDIGTHIGSFLHGLHKKGFKNIQGIDIRLSSIKFGKAKYPEIAKRLTVYDGSKLPFNDNFFDVVTMFDVIEHIHDLDKFFKEVCRVLKKDGLFVFQTPNKYINVIWETIYWRSLTKWRKEHCSLLSTVSLKSLLKENFSSYKLEKFYLNTEFNRNKVRKKFGVLGLLALSLIQLSPLILYPNLWGIAEKPNKNTISSRN